MRPKRYFKDKLGFIVEPTRELEQRDLMVELLLDIRELLKEIIKNKRRIK